MGEISCLQARCEDLLLRNISGMRKFPAEDVVLLEGLRCSGAHHDGCQKACTIFWREAWLRKVEGLGTFQSSVDPEGSKWLRARLKTSSGPKTYFCQASEILNATRELSHWERFGKCFSEFAQATAVSWKWRSASAYGCSGRSGRCCSALRPRKPKVDSSRKPESAVWRVDRNQAASTSITETLNDKGIQPRPVLHPGHGTVMRREVQVKRKLEKIIVDGTGEMRQMRNTVFLEGSHVRMLLRGLWRMSARRICLLAGDLASTRAGRVQMKRSEIA